MSPQPYLYRFEVVAETLRRLGASVEVSDAAEAFPDLIEEDETAGEVLLLDNFALEIATMRLAELAAESGLEGPFDRELASRQVARHENCSVLIETARAVRDDLIVGIDDLQNYVLNGVTLGRYGDLHVDCEAALEVLRPNPERPRRYLGPDHCPDCGELFTHDEGCLLERREVELDERQPHELASHRHCADILAELWQHTDALHADVEELALHLRQTADDGDDGTLKLPVPNIVRSLMWDSMASFELLSVPRSLTAEVLPPLTAKEWCEDDDHTHPHRACRYLVS